MKKTSSCQCIAMIILLSVFPSCKNTTEGYDKQVKALLEKMTLEEKIGQMTQICLSMVTADGTKTLVMDEEKMRQAILEDHVGSFLSGSGTAMEWVEFNTLAQRIAMEESRLGIPLLLATDHIHGANYVHNATILPHNLTLGCSFDTNLVREAANITAMETADLGLSWNFAPVVDLGKNPFWPRLYETYGEDPIVCARMGAAFIDGYQNNQEIMPYRLAACAKHFTGYSDPKSGWDRTPAEIPRQTLYEQFFPPFQAAVDAKVKTVMLNSGEVNGIPVHTSKWLVQDILRKEMGFEGVIVSDIKDIMKVVEMHAGAENEYEATAAAIQAGIDISMACDSYSFINYLKTLVEKGEITESRIDASVKRILTLKYELGLFDHPYPNKERLDRVGSIENKNKAVELAAESLVLLKNDNLLPLEKNTKILLAGHGAHSKRIMNGAWTFEWLGAEEAKQPQEMPTLFESLQKEFGENQISLLEGDYIEEMVNQLNRKAALSDVIVITAGEWPYSEFKGNLDDLSIGSPQWKMVKAAMKTGKPVVLVLLEGRPRLLKCLEDETESIIFAGIPGSGGPEAISGILSGKYNPSGKLCFTYPADQAHVVPYYHKFSETSDYIFPFGHGISYTQFTYENVTLSDTVFSSTDQVKFSVEVTNTGEMTGKEAVLLFCRDVSGQITRPVKELIDFTKIELGPGEKKTITFQINPLDDLSYPDREGYLHLEQGKFIFYCGNCTAEARLVN